ncbi:hypothetical protein MNR01_15435 [Lysobacter sp. S4-A87]|uniref:hypothetical protein n=1 Tax=Lysobacter sp. S4-A87 TaxID=2925843 RepID=UPI001F536EE9|nr:hypothetical protein [Lysobacter sp. S4-A87]UNK49107.1 hypothetical protein MNR01_15435 [Lysobacter sp. S4-A87]
MSHHEHDNQADDRAFDQAMRRLHTQAVDQVSPATRARLRVARQAATTPGAVRAHRRGPGWVLATGFAAVSALAIGLLLRPSPQAPAVGSPAPAVATATTATYDADTALATLDENPDLYLWLASNDDAMPALDQ